MTWVVPWGTAIPKRPEVVLRHHWGQCWHEHPHPSCSFLPRAGPPVMLVQIWLLHEPDWELIWFKSGHENPSHFFFLNMDCFSIQPFAWLYKHLHWYHEDRTRAGTEEAASCIRDILKIKTQALRKCYHLASSASEKMSRITDILE